MSSSMPVAVVTGASRGIGAAVARRLGSSGYEVVVVGRSTGEHHHRVLPGTIDDVAAAIEAGGGRARAVAADLSRPEGVDHLLEAIDDLRPATRLLVNSAAYSIDFGTTIESDPKKWNLAWSLNILAPLRLIQGLAPAMAEAGGGGVVNISSGAGIRTVIGQTPYGVTKIGLERMTQDLANDGSCPGVTFNCLRIETGVPTEAYLYVSGSLGITEKSEPLHTPEEAALAIEWMGTDPAIDGEVFDLARLEAIGVLGPPSFLVT
jgi:NAD(P)-dependent dehydrogenase (short-subunit alcohol dehydrogenase family)